jgi:1-deoxy-D-xylulose-5-phosphate reductoisomerase
MGSKITIDSATMMNKGLEVIEAFWLFNLTKEQIEVIIHPQSIIHSMVEFIDGSLKAQLSSPDMKLPIIYALTYPERYYFKHVQTDFRKINQLTFFEPDFDKFACLKIAYDVIAEGGTATCILNAANEVAVEKFLSGKIKFIQIPELITEALNKIDNHKDADLGTIVECDFRTREFLKKKYN